MNIGNRFQQFVYINLKGMLNTFRIEEESNITSDTQENQSTCRKIEQNHLFCQCHMWCTRCHFAENYFQLLHLLHHGCRQCGLQFAHLFLASNFDNSTNDSFNYSMQSHDNRLPFDWKNPIGYLIVIVLQSVSSFLVLQFLTCMTICTLGSFLFAWSFAKDWKNHLQALHQMVHTKSSKTDILENLNEFIRSHSTEKQLSQSSFMRNHRKI